MRAAWFWSGAAVAGVCAAWMLFQASGMRPAVAETGVAPPSQTAQAGSRTGDSVEKQGGKRMSNEPAVDSQGKPLPKSNAEWRKQLDDAQFEVCRLKGTERPGTGALLHNKEEGVYRCVCCDEPLFTSDTKFDSGTGWPSFFQPVSAKAVKEVVDTSYFMKRVEVVCRRCDAHLGHVFDDGPRPTGLRFCINSVSLKFEPKKEHEAKKAAAAAKGSGEAAPAAAPAPADEKPAEGEAAK